MVGGYLVIFLPKKIKPFFSERKKKKEKLDFEELHLDFFIKLFLPSQEPVQSGTQALWTARFVKCISVQPVFHRQWRLRGPARAQVAQHTTRMIHRLCNQVKNVGLNQSIKFFCQWDLIIM